MKTYQQFINENESGKYYKEFPTNDYYLDEMKEFYLKRVMIIRGYPNYGDKEKRNQINDIIFSNCYILDELSLNDFELIQKDFEKRENMVLLNYTNMDKFDDVTKNGLQNDINKWCKKYNITILNKQSKANKTLDKRLLHKFFPDVKWLSKACYTKEDAINGKVGFPLIAKISDGHSGLGIEKFDTKEELKKYPDTFKLPDLEGIETKDYKFDLFESFIDIDAEYRTIWYKNKMVILAERVDVEMDNTMSKKSSSDKKEFVYVPCDINKLPKKLLWDLTSISAEILTKIDVEVMGIDIAFGPTGKINVLEVNYKSGLREEYIPIVYTAIYEDHYKEQFPHILSNYLKNKIINKDRKQSYLENKKHWEKAMEIKKWRPTNWVVDIDFL